MKAIWDEIKYYFSEGLELGFIGLASIAVAAFYVAIVCAPIALVLLGIYKIVELIVAQ